jgi:hypothetical protein
MVPTCRRKWIAGESLRDVELGSTRGRLRIWMRLILRMTQSFVHDRGVLRSAGGDEGFFRGAVGHLESTGARRLRGIRQHKYSINYFRQFVKGENWATCRKVLRTKCKGPNAALQKLIELNKRLYPGAF